MRDRIFEIFLRRQLEEGLLLAGDSDIIDLAPLDGPPPQHYVADFHCRGLVRTNGEIQEWTRFTVGLFFPKHYLRLANPYEVITLLAPPTPEHPNTFVWHPNISLKAPVICPGKIAPGMSLTDLIHQLYEIFAYQRYRPMETDSLNPACCSWARSNADRFPTDNRPLKRRTLNLEVDES